MKKIYTEPKIKAVTFDPDQAILQVCKALGLYFRNTTQKCVGTSGTSMPAAMNCNTAIRGVRGGGAEDWVSEDNAPS